MYYMLAFVLGLVVMYGVFALAAMAGRRVTTEHDKLESEFRRHMVERDDRLIALQAEMLEVQHKNAWIWQRIAAILESLVQEASDD